MNYLKEARRNPYEFFKKHDWKTIAIHYHPDHGNDGEEFKELRALYEQSQKPPEIFGDYVLVQHIAEGDLCHVYRTECNHIIKIPFIKSRAANQLLAKEKEVLTIFNEAAKETKYKYYFPWLKESIVVDKKRANVFLPQESLYLLTDIKRQHPDGIDGRHIAWMFKRLLVGIGYIHQCGWSHNAVVPQHCMFNISNHGLCLIDWIHAEQLGKEIKVVPKSHKSWYRRKKDVDIWFAAQSVFSVSHILPRRINNFLKGCHEPNLDAWQLHDEFTELLEDVYGPPKFVSLEME